MTKYSRQDKPTARLTALPTLARKMSKAVDQRKGIRLSYAELDLLIIIDVIKLVQTEAAIYQKENALCRANNGQNIFTTGADTGSTGTEKKMEHSAPRFLRSSGTTAGGDASAHLALAQMMLTKRK